MFEKDSISNSRTRLTSEFSTPLPPRFKNREGERVRSQTIILPVVFHHQENKYLQIFEIILKIIIIFRWRRNFRETKLRETKFRETKFWFLETKFRWRKIRRRKLNFRRRKISHTTIDVRLKIDTKIPSPKFSSP